MSAPDRIWLQDAGAYDSAHEVTWCGTPVDDADTEYLRRDPAVLAADPMVLAMIGAAYLRAEIAVGTIDPQNEDDATAQQIAEVEAIRLLTPADALAALERVRQEARNEALEEAAAMADELYMEGKQELPGNAIRARKEPTK